MLLSKLQRYIILGVVSLAIVGAVILGNNYLAQSQEEPDPKDEVLKQETVHPGTEIVVEQWCPNCQERLHPEVPDLLSHWQGFGPQDIEDYLRAEFPGASITSFGPDRVMVQLPPGYCAKCTVDWPEKGYIGLDDDKQIAIYYEDGTFFQTYGPAPGSWMKDLEVGIQFESPEECEQWLINLTS